MRNALLHEHVVMRVGVTTGTVLRFQDNVALVKFGHMLENPCMLGYSSYRGSCIRESKSDLAAQYGSDNSSAAENQQERLIKIGWITGFVDGEGCFSINFIRQPHRHNRRGYRTGFQVAHEFAVAQGAKSVDCLRMLMEFFGVGAVYINKRYDNHKEHMYRYCVRGRNELLKKIIPFFNQNRLRTSKQGDFLKFAECVRLVGMKTHLTASGLIHIVQIAETMNHCKPRTELIRILRDYTPNTDSLPVKI